VNEAAEILGQTRRTQDLSDRIWAVDAAYRAQIEAAPDPAAERARGSDTVEPKVGLLLQSSDSLGPGIVVLCS
jgi:hypothetical protein